MARFLLSIFIVAILAFAQANAAYAAFSVKRSISMDQWVTWPEPSRWNDDDVLDNFPEWRSFVSDDEIARLARAGFDTVRLPVDPSIFMSDPDPIRHARLFAGVRVAIDRLRAAGLNVIVDMHMIPRGDGAALGVNHVLDNQRHWRAYLDLLADMASQLRATDTGHVALEAINEPSAACESDADKAAWNKRLEQMHAEIRATNTDITIVLTGACGGSAEGLAAVDPAIIDDDNVLWSFHSYNPFMLTHQSADWAGHRTRALSRIPYPPSNLTSDEAEDLVAVNERQISAALGPIEAMQAKGFLRDHLQRLREPEALDADMRAPFKLVAQWAERNAIPPSRVFLGEFGMIRQEYGKDAATDPVWRLAYMADMAKIAEEYGFAWSVWSFGGAFGLMQGFGGEPAEAELLEMFPGQNLQN